jgi:hypothetical protein
MFRALMILLRRGVPTSVADAAATAREDTPHDQSPEALAARLDAVEAMINDRRVVHRLKTEATLARVARSTHKDHG